FGIDPPPPDSSSADTSFWHPPMPWRPRHFHPPPLAPPPKPADSPISQWPERSARFCIHCASIHPISSSPPRLECAVQPSTGAFHAPLNGPKTINALSSNDLRFDRTVIEPNWPPLPPGVVVLKPCTLHRAS